MKEGDKNIFSWLKLFKRKGESMDIVAFIAGIFFIVIGLFLFIGTEGESLLFPLVCVAVGIMFIMRVDHRIKRDEIERDKKTQPQPQKKIREELKNTPAKRVLVIGLIVANILVIIFNPEFIIWTLPLLAIGMPVALGEALQKELSLGYYYLSIIILILPLLLSVVLLIIMYA